MRLSLWPSLNQPWADVLALAQFADAAGYDTVYVEDHFIEPPPHDGDPLLESTATLAAIAAATTRVRVGTLVLSVTYRHPAVIANWAAAVDHISAGRLTLGLGAGWQEHEHAAYGLALGAPGERVDRFAEGLEVVLGLLRSPRTTYAGRYYELTDAICAPAPVQRPVPILVGARGPRMLGLVARHADAWNVWGSRAGFSERAGALDTECERAGRDPRSISRSTQTVVKVTDDRAEAEAFRAEHAQRGGLAGPLDQVAEGIAAYAEVGVDEFIVVDMFLGKGQQRFDVLSGLRGLIR